MYFIQNLLPELLGKVPEIRESYEAIRRPQESHEIPARSSYEPGITIIFEDLLVPFVIVLSLDISRSSRLAEVMNWLEKLADSEIPEIRNLVAAGVCEALITNEEEHLEKIQPYMGRKTKDLCRVLFSLYHVSENTVELLKDA